MYKGIKIFSGRGNIDLAHEICKVLKIDLGHAEIVEFPNKNTFVRILESVRRYDVFVIQPSCEPINTNLMELFIMLDAIKSASAGRVTAVLPYYPYVRSDKKDEARISIIAKLVANLLETSGADRILTMDLHAPQIQGFFNIPVDHLESKPVFIDYFKKYDLSNTVIVAPDAGAAKVSGSYAKKLNLPLAILDKRRSKDGHSVAIYNIIGDVKDKDCIMFDDEIATGGSIMNATAALKHGGAKNITVAATHGVFCGNAVDNIQKSLIDKLVVSNTVYIPEEKMVPKLEVLSIAQLVAEAIRRIHIGDSVSSLFNY